MPDPDKKPKDVPASPAAPPSAQPPDPQSKPDPNVPPDPNAPPDPTKRTHHEKNGPPKKEA